MSNVDLTKKITAAHRLAIIEERLSAQTKELDRVARGDVFTAKTILTIFAALIGVGGLIVPVSSLITARRNEDRAERDLEKQKALIKELVHDTKTKIDNIIGKSRIEYAFVKGLSAADKTIVARPELRKLRVESTSLSFYELTFRFHAEIHAKGTGVGKILGLSTKYSGRFVETISHTDSGELDEYTKSINSTKTTVYVTPILFAAHAPSVITWTITVRRKTCADALKTAVEMKNDKDIGIVEATPVLEFSEKEAKSENLKIIIGDLFPTFTCAELDVDKYEKNETAPLSSTAPKSKIEMEDKNNIK